MSEIWKDVFEYEGIYQVSNLANVKSLDRVIIKNNGAKLLKHGQVIKTRVGKDGNVRVNLSKDGVKTVHSLARVIYKAFNPDFDYYDNTLMIIHKNNRSTDNELSNLKAVKTSEVAHSDLLNEKKEKRKVICITTGQKFESISDAERYYNIKVGSGSISRCCQGKNKSSGMLKDGTKLVWRYLEE